MPNTHSADSLRRMLSLSSERLLLSFSDHLMLLLRCSVLVLLPVLVTGCQRDANPAGDVSAREATALRVTPVKAERKSLSRRTEQPGEIEAFETAPLWAKVTGYVRKVHVDIGDHVSGPKFDSDGKLTEPGQLLAEIDVPELAEDVKQKEALVQQAAAAVKVVQAAKISAEANVAEAEAMTARADALYQKWHGEFARVKKLVESNAVTQKVADETEQQFKAADAARRETAAHIKSAKAKLAESEANIEKARADLNVARADADKTQALWGYTQIRAPFDGIVSARQVDTGHLVTASATGSKPLFTVVAAETVRLFADVPEADAALVEKKLEAKIKVAALGGAALEGQITRTSWVLNAGTRTLHVQIDLPNPDGRLRPGMSAQVDLLIAQRSNVVALPKSAVLTQDGQSFCLRIDATNKLVKQAIKTGLKTATDVEITDGLTGNELVIGTNLSAYREGQLVEVISPKP